MALYELTPNELIPIAETTYESQRLYERKDLQRLLKANIEVLGGDLMVVAEEFGEWSDSSRRIDLLCIDKEANLVVVEIKRTADGGHMELQALRYAAMVSAMTFKQLVEAHTRYLLSVNANAEPSQAENALLGFLNRRELDEDNFAKNVRIVLASADFSKELTTSVLWLNDQGLDISCIRMKPYGLADDRIVLDLQQIIPLQEASEYQTQIRTKEQASRLDRTERHDLRYKFWASLLELAKQKTNLHANRKPGVYGWIGGAVGRRGLSLNYATREDDSQVELYIDFGDRDENLKFFNKIKEYQSAIDQAVGGGGPASVKVVGT